jgi:phage terminase large subunit
LEDCIAHLRGFQEIVIHAEARRYSYKVEKQIGGILPIVVDKFNHGWDSQRNALDDYIQRRGSNSVWAKLAG